MKPNRKRSWYGTRGNLPLPVPGGQNTSAPGARSLVGVGTPPTATPPEPATLLETLPAELAAERTSVLAARQDEVSHLVAQLDLHARRLGERFGVHGEPLPLERRPESPNLGLEVLRAMLVAEKTFRLTRHSERWGIFYLEGLTILSAARQPDGGGVVRPLPECSIEVKRRFLQVSRDFFAAYLGRVRETVAGIETDLGLGMGVLEALQRLA
ncbi:MAG: hypothetical protein L0216_17365 [Planctomycetales bacterium]|nr:hypothetical protein [Planctomycetales bacterium]